MNSLPAQSSSRWPTYLTIALVLIVGILLRVTNFETLKGTGFDEGIYSRYVEKVAKLGVFHFPEIFDIYIEDQRASPLAFLPPTRITFLTTATLWHQTFHTSYLESIRGTSMAASVLFLLAATFFAWRQKGVEIATALACLLAFAPTQIYIAHRALIDGFFALIALLVVCSLWEVLQKPRSSFWLWAYGLFLALMVLTKENAAFVYLAVLGILAVTRFLKLGTITWKLLVVTVVGPALGFGCLILCAGGIEPLFTALSLNVKKSYVLPYAIATGDGPWFRYLSDLMLVSPVVLIFAVAGAFQIRWNEKLALYFLCFIVFSYLIMGNLRYGMNLRYALIWDYPLRLLAILPILHWRESIKNARYAAWLTGSLIGIIAFFELASYHNLFVENQIYDLVPSAIMRALKILK